MQKPQRSTWLTKNDADVQRQWVLIDVEGKTLGRAASQIAMILRGKHKPTFTPNVDAGDFVVVVNADKIRLTGNKLKDKLYRYHTLFPGGLRETPAEKLLAAHPERLLQAAVRGMLPKNRLGRKIFKKLKVYAGPEHQHVAQVPRPLALS